MQKEGCTTICCSKGEYWPSLRFIRRNAYINNRININELQKLIEDIKVSKNRPFVVFFLEGSVLRKLGIFCEIAEAMPDERLSELTMGN